MCAVLGCTVPGVTLYEPAHRLLELPCPGRVVLAPARGYRLPSAPVATVLRVGPRTEPEGGARATGGT
ncbi:hypothetical protein GCM10009600_10300 [Oerskovia paurometabola]